MPTQSNNMKTPKPVVRRTFEQNEAWLTDTIEPELAGASIPRVARVKKKTILGFRLLWNAWILAIGLIGFFWRRDYDTWNNLMQHGIVTQATVRDKFISQGKSTYYYLDFVFRTDTTQVEDRRSVSLASYVNIREGDTFPVTYLPKKQEAIWEYEYASAERRDKASINFLWTAIGVSAVFVAVIGGTSHAVRRQLWLLRQGIAITGHIYNAKEDKGKSNSVYSVGYHYTVRGKRYVNRRTVAQPLYEAAQNKNEAFCTILYDATDPERSMPYFSISDAYLAAAEIEE